MDGGTKEERKKRETEVRGRKGSDNDKDQTGEGLGRRGIKELRRIKERETRVRRNKKAGTDNDAEETGIWIGQRGRKAGRRGKQ